MTFPVIQILAPNLDPAPVALLFGSGPDTSCLHRVLAIDASQRDGGTAVHSLQKVRRTR